MLTNNEKRIIENMMESQILASPSLEKSDSDSEANNVTQKINEIVKNYYTAKEV